MALLGRDLFGDPVKPKAQAPLADRLPVLGVVVGASPKARLTAYAPLGWQRRTTLVPAGLDYHVAAPTTDLAGVALDPHYEAKCLPMLQRGDVLWVVGLRQTAAEDAGDALAEKAADAWDDTASRQA